MTPTQARAFLAVALKGSFSEAARSLRVSQPTVTSQVRQIERRYQVELFYRRPRGATLTPTGETLLPLIRRMFGSFEEAGAYLEQVHGRRSGQLRIGSYGPYDAVKVVARFGKRFPAISVSVDFANSQTLTERLIDYDLDVAFIGRIKTRPEFHTLAFRNPSLVVIAPRRSPWAERETVAVRDLRNETIIRREPGSAARAVHDRLFAKAKVAPRRSLEFGSREGVIGAVAEGVGVATIFDEGIIPSDVVKLKIDGPTDVLRVDVVCLADRRQNPLIAGFLDVAREFLDDSRSAAR
jgi:LysR family transcriptional regulator, low CO2-responsive transcriptional regulator